MALINYATKEINAKIVYYGPGLSGKTTNIHYVYQKIKPANKGKLISLATQGDRTLFFDFLPVELGEIRGFKTRFHLYTVPGQVFYNSTRKLVLKGADGVVFVADSQKMMMEENIQSLDNLRQNLRDMGLKPEEFPTIIQYNKRDLPNVASIEEMQDYLNPNGLPYFEAAAMKGDGVLVALTALVKLILQTLKQDTANNLDLESIKNDSGESDAVDSKDHIKMVASQGPATEAMTASLANSPYSSYTEPSAAQTIAMPAYPDREQSPLPNYTDHKVMDAELPDEPAASTMEMPAYQDYAEAAVEVDEAEMVDVYDLPEPPIDTEETMECGVYSDEADLPDVLDLPQVMTHAEMPEIEVSPVVSGTAGLHDYDDFPVYEAVEPDQTVSTDYLEADCRSEGAEAIPEQICDLMDAAVEADEQEFMTAEISESGIPQYSFEDTSSHMEISELPEAFEYTAAVEEETLPAYDLVEDGLEGAVEEAVASTKTFIPDFGSIHIEDDDESLSVMATGEDNEPETTPYEVFTPESGEFGATDFGMQKMMGSGLVGQEHDDTIIMGRGKGVSDFIGTSDNNPAGIGQRPVIQPDDSPIFDNIEIPSFSIKQDDGQEEPPIKPSDGYGRGITSSQCFILPILLKTFEGTKEVTLRVNVEIEIEGRDADSITSVEVLRPRPKVSSDPTPSDDTAIYSDQHRRVDSTQTQAQQMPPNDKKSIFNKLMGK